MRSAACRSSVSSAQVCPTLLMYRASAGSGPSLHWRVMTDRRANDRMSGVLEELVASGRELGMQLAAYKDGQLVVDTWAGVANRETRRPVDGDTLFTVFSTSKGIAATCAHILAERGQLDYDSPVARYWPEFAHNGKARATVADALAHRIGVPQLPPNVTPEQLCDAD